MNTRPAWTNAYPNSVSHSPLPFAAAIRLAYESKPGFDLQPKPAAALARAVRKGFRDGSASLHAADEARASKLVAFLSGE